MELEQELKLIGDEAFDKDTLAAALAAVAELSAPHARTVRDIYMDTRSRSLARAGLAARPRRDGRKVSVQVKPVLIIPELVVKRQEFKEALPRGADPGRAIRKLVEGNLQAKLVGYPVPELEVMRTRTTYKITGPSGGEAVLDIDEAMALLPGKRKGPGFVEVELEYAGGAEADFELLMDVMLKVEGLSPGGISKHRRSMKLLGLQPYAPAAPAYRFEATTASDEAARGVCMQQWQTVRGYEGGTRVGLDLEYLHKMRVATRRLRAALRAFECCFNQAEQDYMQRNLRWLAAVLGEVRDLDVQLLDLRTHRARLGPEPEQGWDELEQVLEAEHRAARERMLRAVESVRYQRLCAKAEKIFGATPRRPANHPGRRPALMLAREMVGRRGRQVLKAAKKCTRSKDVELVHELRIKGKKLRYVAEFFAPLFGPEFKKTVKRLARFQDLLGLFNDACVLGE